MNKLHTTLTFLLLFLTLAAKAEMYAFSYTFDASDKGTQDHTFSGIVEGTLLDDGDTIIVSSLVRVSLAGNYYNLSDVIGIRAIDPSEQPRISLSGETLDVWVCIQGYSQFYEDGSGDCQLATESGFLLSDAGALDVTESWAIANLSELGDGYYNSDIPINLANWSAQRVPKANTGFTVFSDNVNAGWPLWDCCAASTPSVEVDDAEHGTVAEFSILGVPETVQGFYSRNTGNPYDASSDATFSFEMKIVTGAIDTSAPWFLKIEADNNISNTVDFNLNTSKEGVEPVVGEWQTYTFDVATWASAGIELRAIDVIGIFPAWGRGSGAVYRVDNVLFGDGGSNGEELITNGTFDNNTEGWTATANTSAVISESDDNVFQAEVSVSSEPSDINLNQTLNLLPDASYILSFRGKASVDRSIIAGLGLDQAPSTTSSETVGLSTDWQDFTYTLTTSNFGNDNSRVFFDLGTDVGTVSIDDISLTLQSINFEPLPEPEPMPIPTPIPPVVEGQALIVFADDLDPAWPLWDCCAGSTPTVEVDDDEHGKVAEFSVLGAPETVQGFSGRDVGSTFSADADGTFSFEMKLVTSPAAGTPWILKVEGFNNTSDTGDINLNTSKEGLDPVVGQWQTYTFDVATLQAAGLDISMIDVVAIFPLWGAGSGAVYRLDNVMFTTVTVEPEPEPTPTPESGLIVFADDVNSGWPLWDCCSGSTPTVEVDDTEHGNVAEFSIFASAETVQGFNSRNSGTRYDASNDATFSFEMKIVTGPADAGTPWLLKIEADNNSSDTGDFNLNTSKEGVDPVIGEWQTYTFDVATLEAAGLNVSAIDLVIIFPTWGLGSGAVYRVDNVIFSASDTATTPDPELTAQRRTIMAFDDVNADGVADWVDYSIQGSDINMSILSGDDVVSLASFDTTHSFEVAHMHKLGDHSADGISEIGIYGFNSDVNRYQLVVLDGQTGQKLATFNWAAPLNDAELVMMGDITNDGISDYAITGIHKENGTRHLVTKNGANLQSHNTFIWPNLWDNTKIVTMSDVTDDGIPEVALYGRHTRINKGQLFVYDGSIATTKLEVYNWNKLWDDIQLFEMDDVDGEGTKDWGQFGKRKDDGRYQWIVKKGHDKAGVIRTFSWPADLENVSPILVADRTADGVRDVAITGTHKTTGRIFLRINDGKLANTRIANMSWPANWDNHQVRELGDLNSDGFNEYAMLGYLKSNGNVQLVVKDGESLTEYGRYTMVGDWEELMLNSSDVNADGNPDVMVSGLNKNTGTREYIFLNGTNLELLWHR